MSKLKSFFQYSLKHHPVATNIFVYGSFYMVADLSQQKYNQHYLHVASKYINLRPRLVGKRFFYILLSLVGYIIHEWFSPEKPEINYAASARVSCVGGFIFAPVLYYWYRYLDRIMPGNRTKYVLTKVAMDQGCMTPLLITSFFIVHSILEGRPDIFEELQQKFWKTFLYNQCFWIPGQTINFYYMPPELRVVYVASVSFIWINLLCFVKREKLDSKSK